MIFVKYHSSYRLSLPLYEGVDWNIEAVYSFKMSETSPSLRGSGLKCHFPSPPHLSERLPLYEGVDWNGRLLAKDRMQCSVSLFTREWIEMVLCKHFLNHSARSPSLRGSGLKYDFPVVFPALLYSLPLYEGVDWNGIVSGWLKNSFVSLFTREWIEIAAEYTALQEQLSPSLRGSGLKSPPPGCVVACRLVSLFTREWIEMCFGLVWWARSGGLPLYKGVDWNGFSWRIIKRQLKCLPLYEGVDWNASIGMKQKGQAAVSLFTREWIEIPKLSAYTLDAMVSLFTREWIESLCS